MMYNDPDGYGSVSVTPAHIDRCNQFAHYQVKRLTLYAEAVHDVKVRYFKYLPPSLCECTSFPSICASLFAVFPVLFRYAFSYGYFCKYFLIHPPFPSLTPF